MQEKRGRKPRTRHLEHLGTVRAYRFPLLVPPEQNAKLFAITALCWEIRNILVTERESNRCGNRQLKAAGCVVHYLTRASQYVRVAQIAKEDRRFSVLHSQGLQNVAERVSEGTKRWLEAVYKRIIGASTACCRTQGRAQLHLSTTRIGCTPEKWSADLSKIGPIRVLDFRKMRWRPKSVT